MMNRFEIDDLSVVNWPSLSLSVTINSFSQLNSIPSIVTNIRFRNGVGNDLNYVNSSSFTRFLLLKRIEIGNDCFQNVREFVINGLPNLERVKVGEKCFHIGDEEQKNGSGSIENCPKLESLITKSYSFKDFKEFTLSKVNSLKYIDFGENSFMFANCILNGK